MSTSRAVSLGMRMLFLGSALWLAALVDTPWLEMAGLTLLTCALLIPDFVPAKDLSATWKLMGLLAWTATAWLVAGLLLPARQRGTVLDPYFSCLAWCLAASVALAGYTHPLLRTHRRWDSLAMGWALLGVIDWLLFSYLQNQAGAFYLGLALAVVWLALCNPVFTLRPWARLSVNTVILFFLLLPLANLAVGPANRPDTRPGVADDSYLYERAKGNAHAFQHWWGKYLGQYARLMDQLFTADPSHQLPCLVRPNSQCMFFQSLIHINSLGFRGREIPLEKGNAYRIVALGESNTFGFTLNPAHKPWPEILEDIIRDRLRPQRPVEVINAGLPNYGLGSNLYRLRHGILALKPDLLISYHGWNTFGSLYPSLPPHFTKHLPTFKRRPLRLLAEAEFRIKLLLVRSRLAAKPIFDPPPISKLMESPCAAAYEELIELARTNHIRLVLATYSMAVTPSSDPAVVEFYREMNPSIYATMGVNLLQTMVLRELARRHPEVELVDTNPDLDGQHWKFIDPVHFSPAGDQQMAETMFHALCGSLGTEATIQ